MSTAGSATRAAFVQHQAHRDNMADVAAKDGSQVRLFVTSLLLSIIPLLSNNFVIDIYELAI